MKKISSEVSRTIIGGGLYGDFAGFLFAAYVPVIGPKFAPVVDKKVDSVLGDPSSKIVGKINNQQ